MDKLIAALERADNATTLAETPPGSTSDDYILINETDLRLICSELRKWLNEEQGDCEFGCGT